MTNHYVHNIENFILLEGGEDAVTYTLYSMTVDFTFNMFLRVQYIPELFDK